MTYEEIVERVRKKSTICSKCGCFVSSLLDCCPACGWKAEKKSLEDRARDSLVESYKALGGNSAVENIEEIRAARKRIPKRKDVGLEMMTVLQTLYDRMLDDGSLDSDILYFIDNQSHNHGLDSITADEYFRRQNCITFDDIDAVRSSITCIPSSAQLGDIKGLPGQIVYCSDTRRCYLYKADYQWVPYYNPGVRFSDFGESVTLYADDKPFHTEYTDYAACYQKRKVDELKAQLQTEKLYYDAIKALKSYSGNKEEKKEYVYHYPF